MIKIIKKILEFLNVNRSSEPRDKEQTLFDVSKYERPGYINYKKCPRCNKEAHTNKEVGDIFGLMNVRGHIYIQSWCRECRKKEKTVSEKSLKERDLF